MELRLMYQQLITGLFPRCLEKFWQCPRRPAMQRRRCRSAQHEFDAGGQLRFQLGEGRGQAGGGREGIGPNGYRLGRVAQHGQAGIEGQRLPFGGHGHELQHPRHSAAHGRVLSGTGLRGRQQARQVGHQPPGPPLAHPAQPSTSAASWRSRSVPYQSTWSSSVRPLGWAQA